MQYSIRTVLWLVAVIGCFLCGLSIGERRERAKVQALMDATTLYNQKLAELEQSYLAVISAHERASSEPRRDPKTGNYGSFENNGNATSEEHAD